MKIYWNGKDLKEKCYYWFVLIIAFLL